MTIDERLASIVTDLEGVGIKVLVMGGHAVRFYGLERNTSDFDLQLSPDCWADLEIRLRQTSLFGGGVPPEGPSWRPNSFRRFQIGTLVTGREEWLEFWRDNHLLASFPEAYTRRVEGRYGGRPLPFLALDDLIRSKETERESDWQDVALLEEFLDASLLAQARAGGSGWATPLARVRSRRGFEAVFQQGICADASFVRQALDGALVPITQAYLLPFCAAWQPTGQSPLTMEPVVLSRLRTAVGGSPLHLALVEVVRRQYKADCQARDRANKQGIRATQTPPR